MKYIVILIIAINAIIACSPKQSETQTLDSAEVQKSKEIPILYIQTVTVIGTGDKQKPQKRSQRSIQIISK